MGVPARTTKRHLRHRHPRGQPQGNRIIAATPKPPVSPARHTPRPRNRAVKRALAEPPLSPGSPRKKAMAAGPKKAAASWPVPKTEPSRLEKLHKLILASLEDDKAVDIVTLDLTGKAMFCARMIIASRSE